MEKVKKKKCVLILTEGKSDRNALTGFFDDLYERIDPDIDVYFARLNEVSQDAAGNTKTNYDGDITSKIGVTPDNILGLILKMFIHPELKKHSEYEKPGQIVEIIHFVDIDGVYLDDKRIIQADEDDNRKLPYYDDKNDVIIVKDKKSFSQRNKRKRKNLEKLFTTKKLEITMRDPLYEGENLEMRNKTYRVYYFSSNLDHVLFGKTNSTCKVRDASSFNADFFDEYLKMAKFFIDHPNVSGERKYQDSWNKLVSDNYSLKAKTNIDLLVLDLLKRANVKRESLPENDIRKY